MEIKRRDKTSLQRTQYHEIGSKKRNLVLQQCVPCLATQCISNDELEDIKWEISEETVKPYHTSPAPTNALDPSKTPI